MTVSLGPSRRIVASAHYKWLAYGAIATGIFLTVMDQSGVNLAIPRIAERFVLDIPTAQWIVLGYVLSTSALLLPMGRVSDMLGRERVFMSGLLGFIALGALGGASQTFQALIVAKVLQGVAAAAIQANGMAMIMDVFPRSDRGQAIGMYMTIIGTGSITGPIAGGLLVSAFGWRAVFYAGVPVGLIAFLAAALVLQRTRPVREAGSWRSSFDWTGAVLSSAALVAFLLAMTNAYRLGWSSPQVVSGLVLAVLMIASFVFWERRTRHPMLDLSLFRAGVFSIGVSARSLSFLASSSVFFLMPFFLIQVLDYSARDAGLMMLPGSVLMATMGPISGRLSDSIGTRWLAAAGMALSASAMLVYSRLGVDSPAIHVMLGMALSGAGMGTFSSTNTSAITIGLGRERYGIVSALLNVTRTASNVTGIAIATTIVAFTMASMGYEPSLAAVSESGGQGLREAFVAGIHRVYLVAAGLAVAAMVLSVLRGESRVRAGD